jgi:hypothetical protein
MEHALTSHKYAYPPELAEYVHAHWPKDHALELSLELLSEVLAICFQASMTAEEGRPTRFRLLLTPPERLPENGAPNEGVLRLRFEEDRPMTADELRRLSPATPFKTSLICGYIDDGKLRIWGIAHSGPAWLAPTWGGRSLVPTWTSDPIIHVTDPGHLVVRSAGKTIGGVERGMLVGAALDIYSAEWLREMFAEELEEVRAAHFAQQIASAFPTEVEHSLIGTISQQLLRRAIQLIRDSRHGGMILIVGEVPMSLHLKYRFAGDEPPRRFRALLFELIGQLAAGTEKTSIGWSDFVADSSPRLERLEESIFELSRMLAALSAIDGAVVLNKRFDLIGFGAEVSAELPAPARVWRAIDVEGQELRVDQIESVGTRHRAAYRFVHDHPAGLAIVVSSDGAVRFVANREQQVVFWELSASP